MRNANETLDASLTLFASPALAAETVCDDGQDNDADSMMDCADADCAKATNCQPSGPAETWTHSARTGSTMMATGKWTAMTSLVSAQASRLVLAVSTVKQARQLQPSPDPKQQPHQPLKPQSLRPLRHPVKPVSKPRITMASAMTYLLRRCG